MDSRGVPLRRAGDEAHPVRADVGDAALELSVERGRQRDLDPQVAGRADPFIGPFFRVEHEPRVEADERPAVGEDPGDHGLEIVGRIADLIRDEEEVGGLELDVELLSREEAHGRRPDVGEGQDLGVAGAGRDGGDLDLAGQGFAHEGLDLDRVREEDHFVGPEERVAELELGQVPDGHVIGHELEERQTARVVHGFEFDADSALVDVLADDPAVHHVLAAVGKRDAQRDGRAFGERRQGLEEHAVLAEVDQLGLAQGPGLDADVPGAVERDPHGGALLAGPLGDEKADLPPNGGRVSRLGQTAVDAAVAGQIDDGPVRRGFGQKDLDDGIGVLEKLVEETEQFGALHPGQVFVDDEDVDLGEGLDQLDGLDAARRRVHGVDVPQGPLEFLEIGEVVVDDEDDGQGVRGCLFHLLSRHLRSGLPGTQEPL
jgi:hypothetical protein